MDTLNTSRPISFVIIWLIAAFALMIMLAALTYGFVYGDFSNEGNRLINMPWGIVTLIDVYIGLLFFSAWVGWRETNTVKRLFWIISFMCLGNLATAVYLFKALTEAEGDISIFFQGHKHENAHVQV